MGMPLLIKLTPEGLFSPSIFCDHCGQEIVEAEDGHYQWRAAVLEGGQVFFALKKGETTDIYFTHKHCRAAFEAESGGRGDWWTEELSGVPEDLANTLKSKHL
jgi:hypothetical protein